jgi:hypothetical protein
MRPSVFLSKQPCPLSIRRARGSMPVHEHGIDHGVRLVGRTLDIHHCLALYPNHSRASYTGVPYQRRLRWQWDCASPAQAPATPVATVGGGEETRNKKILHSDGGLGNRPSFPLPSLPTLPRKPHPNSRCIHQCRYISLHLLPTFSPRSVIAHAYLYHRGWRCEASFPSTVTNFHV